MLIILSTLVSTLEQDSDYFKFLLEYKGGQEEYLDTLNKTLSCKATRSNNIEVRARLTESLSYCADFKSLYESFLRDVDNIYFEVSRLVNDNICPDILEIKIVDGEFFVKISSINNLKTYENINKLKRYMHVTYRNTNRNRCYPV